MKSDDVYISQGYLRTRIDLVGLGEDFFQFQLLDFSEKPSYYLQASSCTYIILTWTVLKHYLQHRKKLFVCGFLSVMIHIEVDRPRPLSVW